MRLRNVGLSFRSKYKIVDGQHFYGQILDMPDTSRVSNFLSARRYLRTTPLSPVTSGQVVQIDQTKFLIGDHGEGFFRNPIYKHFKMFEVDTIKEWFTLTEVENPVTGVKEKSTPQSQGNIYISTQPKSSIDDSIHIPMPKHVIITNANLSVDDKIGTDWVVIDVDYQLGLCVAEVKEA